MASIAGPDPVTLAENGTLENATKLSIMCEDGTFIYTPYARAVAGAFVGCALVLTSFQV